MYYIIFYYFKYDPSLCDILGKLRVCDLEDMGQFLLDLYLSSAHACYQVSKGH